MLRSGPRLLFATLAGVLAYGGLVLALDLDLWMTRISASGTAPWYGLAVLLVGVVAGRLLVAGSGGSPQQRGWRRSATPPRASAPSC